MELIATARFKKAMDRASASTAYTKRITALVADLANAGLSVSHPLLETRPEIKSARLLVLTGNRGLCGGYNSNVRYLNEYLTGQIDRLDVAYTRFDSIAKQTAVVETLLPLGAIEGLDAKASDKTEADAKSGKAEVDYEFLPSAASILEEVVPTSFKVKLFKCFLDAAVSEQVARMTAMKAATDNANKIIKKLSMTYNRARQSQITGEIMEVLGGVEALKNK